MPFAIGLIYFLVYAGVGSILFLMSLDMFEEDTMLQPLLGRVIRLIPPTSFMLGALAFFALAVRAIIL